MASPDVGQWLNLQVTHFFHLKIILNNFLFTHNEQKRTVLVMVNFLGFQTMVIDPFHAVVVFGLGFDFSFRLVSSVPKNRDIRGLYYSSLIFPTPTTWPFCRPADRHLHVRAWLSLLLISVTMKMTKWKWCEQNWSIRKKNEKKNPRKQQQIGRSNILWVSWFKNI